MANPYPANFETLEGGGRLTGQVNFTDPANQPGVTQDFIVIVIVHSADFANVAGTAPVIDGTTEITGALSLPPSAFTDLHASVGNETAIDVQVSGQLVVYDATGATWIDRVASAQTFAAGGGGHVDFETDGGSAGANLSWNAVSKQIDIAGGGVYGAFVTLRAVPA